MDSVGRRVVFVVGVVLWTAVEVAAGGLSETEVQLLHGSGFELGERSRQTLTFNHFSAWNLGSNFFFFDVEEPFSGTTEVYGEWYPRLSLQRLSGAEPREGPLSDVSLALAINAGSDLRAFLAGVTLHFNLWGFNFIDVDLMVYDDRNQDGVTYIVTPAWDRSFEIGRFKFCFRGFVDFIGPEGNLEAQILAQPQLLVDFGDWFGSPGRFWAGIEYQYWRNKYGIDGVNESFPQIMVAWRF